MRPAAFPPSLSRRTARVSPIAGIARLAACTALLASGIAQADGRSRLARFELEGPLADLRFDCGAAGETRVEGVLLAGERRELVLPVPVPAIEGGAPAREPRPAWHSPGLDAESAGRVRFRGWVAAREPAFEEVPAALRARPRPPVGTEDARLAPSLGWLLAAVFVAGLSLRRRIAAAFFVSAAGVAAVIALGPRPAGEDGGALGAATVVIEGSAGSELWLRVEAARERLSVPPGEDPGRIEVDPPAARLVWRIPLAGDRPARLEAEGARLVRLQVEPRGERSASAEGNRLGLDLAAAWVREDGAWTAHGAWPVGAPLPPAREAPPAEAGPDSAGRAPPGWLASALPQGTSILLGRGASTRPVWVRISGF